MERNKIIKILKCRKMKYLLIIFLLVFSTIYANILSPIMPKVLTVVNKNTQVKEVKFQGGFEKFKKKFRLKESTNNPDTINSTGMLGFYGFGSRARKECGYEHITIDGFRHNPKIWSVEDQDKAFIKYLKINKKRISSIIKMYNNKVIGGVVITESGLLAACHLVGAGNVKKYFETNGEFVFSDNNKTTTKDYLREFSGYKFNLAKL